MIRKRLALILVIFLFSVIYVNFISAQETGNGNQTGNETNYTAEYDPEILSAFENQTWLPVVVRLVDNSGINVTGTKEERRALSKQTREWFEPVVNEVLGTLSKDEFEIHNKLFNGFAGEITKEGFDVLLNNINVREIIWDNVPLGEAVLDDSVPLINANDVWSSGYTGDGIKVCVIDTGVNASHPDLSGKITDEYCYCSAHEETMGTYDCCPDGTMQDDDAEDNNGHGTHVVGIIASQDSTYKGVGYDSNIYVVKVLNSSGGLGSWGDVSQAITWCQNQNVDVISLSMGNKKEYGPSGQHGNCPNSIDDEINAAYNDGIPVVISSGNDGYTNGISYPACSANALSVGASTKSDTMAWFTNRGNGPDLLAPGQSIISLRWNSQKTSSGCTAYGSDFMVCSGTSQATPHVSGAAALLLDAKSSLTPDQIETALEDTGKSVSGYPRINVSAALNSVCDADGDGYQTESCGGNDCDDSDASVHPGATEVCDDVDNDCDDIIDEGCTEDCTEPGYDQCAESSYGDCDVSIAVNYYTNVNTIEWGAVNDAWDPYVIDEYKVGWKAVDAERMYYDVDDPNNDCDYDGCTGTSISSTGTRVTTNAPATASTENLLGHSNTASYWCTVWFNGFNPSYGASNPIYVLKCFDDSDCSGGYYCDKSGSWSSWDCVAKKSDGQSCTSDSLCQSNYCDVDGVGLSDDGWCFTPYNTYFDGQETSYCEYSADNGIADCDERQTGDDLDKCIGTTYYEEECSSTCTYQDITSVFECTETGCSCTESLCDGLTTGGNITTCASGQTYFADKCTSTASGEDRGDNICRNSSFASGCTADAECNGIGAGTGYCTVNCTYNLVANITVISLTQLHTNNTLKIFEFIIQNNGGTNLNNINWTIDFGDGNTAESLYKFNLSSSEDIFVFVEHEYADNQSHTVTASAYVDNLSSSKQISVGGETDLQITSFEELYSMGREKVWEFVVKNNANDNLSTINWNITGTDTPITSIYSFNLASNESIRIYIHENLTNYQAYTITAKAFTDSLSDTETLSTRGKEIEISNIKTLYTNGLTKVFEFLVTNTYTSAINNLNWSFDTGESTIDTIYSFNLTSWENIRVLIENNYSGSGNYNINASVKSSQYEDSENKTVTV